LKRGVFSTGDTHVIHVAWCDVRLFVRHPTQQSPLNKESPCKFIFHHTWKTICSIDILFITLGPHALRETQIAAYYSSSLHKRPLREAGLRYQVLESPTSFIGTFTAHRTPPTHTAKFGAWLSYHLWGLRTLSQKTSLLGRVAQIHVYPRTFCL